MTTVWFEPDDGDLLTDWEIDFLASIECQDFDLTQAQEAKIADIEERLEERRAAWRASLDLPALTEVQKKLVTKKERRLEESRERWRAWRREQGA